MTQAEIERTIALTHDTTIITPPDVARMFCHNSSDPLCCCDSCWRRFREEQQEQNDDRYDD